MSDQDIRDQLEGLFSDIVPESDVVKEGASPPVEASPGPAGLDTAGTEVAQAEQAPAPKATGSSEEKWSSKPSSPPVSEPQWHVLASIRARLIFFLVLAATLPLIVAGVWSFYTLQSTIQAASDRSEAALVELGESSVAQTARATARQLELYLDTHPDVNLNDLTQLESNTELAELAVQPVGKTGYTAVFDENAITHFHANPGTVGMDMSTLADTLPQFWAIFAASLDGSPSDGYYDWEDADGQVRAKYMSIVPVGNTRLRVAATTYIDEFSEPVAAIRSQLASIQRTALIQLLLALVGVFLIATTGTLLIGRWVSRPISRMAAMVAYIEKGERRLTGLEGRRDEFGILARAFNRMATQVQQTVDNLEQRIAERTRVLELAAQVGSRLSIVHGLDGLLAEAARLIQENFGLYHTLIYLADPAGRSLVLRAGAGEAGAELLRRGNSLPVGPGSISGAAAAQKQAVLVSDTIHSPAFRPNPLLPDTRSETAVPLLIGERLVGVLDLQSAQPGALTPEKLIAFEALAGQLAVAIDNARLFSEAAQARADVEAQAQRQTRRGWEEFLDGIERGERIDYAYERGNLEPMAEPRDETPEAHSLTVPIQIQGASMGAIQIEGEAGRIWTQSDAELVETVVRQVAQQADNLRLLAQAEGYRAQAEGASRRLTREGWASFLETQATPVAGFAYDLFQVKPVTNGSDAGEPALSRPLEVRGETIGHLAVEEAGELDEEATQLLTTVAERLSDHIENLRLLEEAQTRRYEVEERSRELEASQRVTFAASETSDPDELLDLVVNLIRDQFDLYHAQMYLVDSDRQAAVLHKSTGYAGRQLLEAGHSIPLEESSLVTRAIRQGEPLVVNDVSEDEDWMPNPLLPHTRSELVVPLRVGGGVIGALDVQSRTPGSFTPRTVALFQTMAEQVAMNFATTDLLARTTEQAEALTRFATQLRTAADVTERLSAILDPDQLLSEVVEMLHSRFGLYHAHVYLMETPPTGEEAKGAQLVVRAGSGEVGKILCERGHRISLDAAKSLVARAARDRQTVYVEDTTTKSDFMPNPLLPQTRSEVAMPLIAGDQVLGVLDVQDDQPGRFTEADLDTFTTLAGQVATALENARLFTEQQQTQQALRESEAQQRLVFESSPTPTLVTQVDGTILYANPQVSRLFGKPLEELISHGAPGLYYDPSERQAFLDAMERDGRVRNYDIRFKKADGTIIWGLLSSEPITFDGKPAFVNGVYDITELKEAEQALLRLGIAVEQSVDGIAVADMDGNIQFANPAWAQMHGYSVEEILDRHLSIFHTEEQLQEEVIPFNERVMETGSYQDEIGHVRKDGTTFPTLMSTAVIKDKEGKPIGLVGTARDITERKQAEEALLESQQMLQLIMNNIPHSIFWKDKDLSYLGCNQNFANDAGKESPEEIIGKTDYDMPWLDQAELYRADDRRVMEADEPVLNYEEPQTTPDGGQIWLRTSKVPLHDATGDVMAVLGLYEDVTAEKQAEQILRESEERFRGLYESSPLGIILNDYERGDYLEANDAFLEMMGYTLEELNQLSYFDVTPQKYEADEAEQIRSMEETGRYGPYEKEYIRKDGSIFPVLLNGVLVTDSRGRKLIWSTVADITERVRAEQERERFTNQLRTAADLTEQVNAILDPDQLLGEVVTQLHDRFNLYHVHVYLLETPTSDPLTGGEAGGAQLMMRAGSGEIGQVMLEREHKILLDREQSLVARAARTGEIVHAADTALDADFMPNPLLPETRSEVAVPLMAGDRVLGILDVQDNQPGRFTQSDLDIFSTLAGQISTALQNAGLFEEVQQTAERLREVDRLKSEFLANMSHELRTPLNSILGYTEVMLMGLNGDLDPDTQEDVQAIYDNGQHLLRLINDVLDLAKIEAGRMALNIEDVEIAPLLEDIKTNSAGLLVNKPVEMILEIDEELPSIKADRTRVNQVLTNLVSNAAKFTEQGQVTLRAFCEDDEWICLEVQDTGIGIQEADLESIFEQFRQADGSFKRRAEGTGLGLAITRHLVTMHGGTISVHSQVGSGSTFTVRLPIRSRVVEAISGSSDGQQV